MIRKPSPRAIQIGSVAVASALLAALAFRVDAGRVAAALADAKGSWLLAAIGFNATIQLFGGLQWHSLIPRGAAVARLRAIRLFSLTSVANNTTPSIVGHAVGGMLIGAEPGVGPATGFSVIVVDQACVGIAKLAVLVIAASFAPMPDWMRSAIGGVAGLVVLLGAALIVVPRASAALARRLAPLTLVARPSRVARAIAFAVFVKLAEGAGIAAVQLAFGIQPTVARVGLVLAATSLSSVVPIAPANLGTYEAATFAAYRALGVSPDAALGIAVAQHACLLVAAIVPGYATLLVGPPVRSASVAEPEGERAGMNDAEAELVMASIDRP